MLKGNVDKALAGFAKNIIKTVILIFAILAAIGRLGVQTTSLIAVIGAAGLAIGMALQGTLSNFTAIDSRRVDMVFGISYADDMKKARDVLSELVASDPRVLKEPASVVAVSELGDSSVNLVCRPWVKPADYWTVCFDITEKGKEALEANGLSIPFPRRDIHVFQEALAGKSSRI